MILTGLISDDHNFQRMCDETKNYGGSALVELVTRFFHDNIATADKSTINYVGHASEATSECFFTSFCIVYETTPLHNHIFNRGVSYGCSFGKKLNKGGLGIHAARGTGDYRVPVPKPKLLKKVEGQEKHILLGLAKTGEGDLDMQLVDTHHVITCFDGSQVHETRNPAGDPGRVMLVYYCKDVKSQALCESLKKQNFRPPPFGDRLCHATIAACPIDLRKISQVTKREWQFEALGRLLLSKAKKNLIQAFCGAGKSALMAYRMFTSPARVIVLFCDGRLKTAEGFARSYLNEEKPWDGLPDQQSKDAWKEMVRKFEVISVCTSSGMPKNVATVSQGETETKVKRLSGLLKAAQKQVIVLSIYGQSADVVKKGVEEAGVEVGLQILDEGDLAERERIGEILNDPHWQPKVTDAYTATPTDKMKDEMDLIARLDYNECVKLGYCQKLEILMVFYE